MTPYEAISIGGALIVIYVAASLGSVLILWRIAR